MQADLSRTTFEAAKHFSAVLSQQGRVQLDADSNEQAAILLHQLRTVVADLIGPAGAPVENQGFLIGGVKGTGGVTDLDISGGRMYVKGILVENDAETTYWEQPDGYLDQDADPLPKLPYVVYLRVWERLITALEDPTLREIALGDPGPDTAARSKVIWQVATHAVAAEDKASAITELTEWTDRLSLNRGQLAAKALRPQDTDADPCHLPPDARFRGPENQLYRVEVHSGGQAWPKSRGTGVSTKGKTEGTDHKPLGATFKWSRENASVVFPVVSVSRSEVVVGTLGRDGKLALEVGDRVELVDDASAERLADDVALDTGNPVIAQSLRTVVAIDPVGLLVTLDRAVDDDQCGPGSRLDRHPVLRRWDNGASTTTDAAKLVAASDGALPLVEGVWIDLEDGVQVQFTPPFRQTELSAATANAATYRGGDYWQIPARTISGDVLWPQDGGGPSPKDPDGVEYSYAPLAYLDESGTVSPLSPVFLPLGAVPATPGLVTPPVPVDPVGADATAVTSVTPAAAQATEVAAPVADAQPWTPQPFPRQPPPAEGTEGRESTRFRGPQDGSGTAGVQGVHDV